MAKKKEAEELIQAERLSNEALRQIGELFSQHGSRILKVFSQASGALSVSVNVNLAGTEPVSMKTTMSYTESTVKDHRKGEVYLTQERIPGTEGEKPSGEEAAE